MQKKQTGGGGTGGAGRAATEKTHLTKDSSGFGVGKSNATAPTTNYVHHPLHGTARSNSNLAELNPLSPPLSATDGAERGYELVPVKTPSGQGGDAKARAEGGAGEGGDGDSQVRRAIKWSIGVNVVLAVAKLYAVVQSGSLAVLASLMDSALDLISQLVVAYTEQRARAAFDVR